MPDTRTATARLAALEARAEELAAHRAELLDAGHPRAALLAARELAALAAADELDLADAIAEALTP